MGAAFGAAGQRCMALSTAVFVGEAKEWIPEIIERARKLRVNEGELFSLHNHIILPHSLVCTCGFFSLLKIFCNHLLI